ncbi:hypothetical protein LEQ41_08050 [Streptococcus agalactiae]|nr:hypothetical protein [Streptococcus agalactiae]
MIVLSNLTVASIYYIINSVIYKRSVFHGKNKIILWTSSWFVHSFLY